MKKESIDLLKSANFRHREIAISLRCGSLLRRAMMLARRATWLFSAAPKRNLLSLAIGLSILKLATADTISSNGSSTGQQAKQESISSGQYGKPARVVKQTPAPAQPTPLVVVPVNPDRRPDGASAGK